jgi:hypothetical protein
MTIVHHPISYQNKNWEFCASGIYLNHEVYCHLREIENPKRQINDYLPVESVFNFDQVELIKKIADFRVSSSDEICINWGQLNEEGYSFEGIQKAIRQGVEACIFYRQFGGVFVGSTLHLSTRPKDGEMWS